MSAETLQWSTTAIVTTHDWGILVHDEGGAHQLKGAGLGPPVDWLRSRLRSPIPREELLASLPLAAHDRMRRLLDALTTHGAVVATPTDTAQSEAPTVWLAHGEHPAAAALARQLSGRLVGRIASPAVGEWMEPECVDGTVCNGTDPRTVSGFRVIITGEELWLGLFPGPEAQHRAAAAELLRHVQRAGAGTTPDPADCPWEAWVPWLSRTLLVGAVETPHRYRCVRLSWMPYRLDEHRLVLDGSAPAEANTPAPSAPDQLPEDPADPLVLSRRCAPLVDDVTSPLGVPTESGLQQLPLQLSACRVRLADGSVRTVTGHGWTLEEARGRAVGAAVLEHGRSWLTPEVSAHPYNDTVPSDSDAPVQLHRTDVERLLAKGHGAAAHGATAADSVRAAAVRVAADLTLQQGWGSWRAATLSSATPGADLLALHQDRTQLLVATGLPFTLAALQVSPGTVVAGVSTHDEQDAVKEAVIQALLYHQAQDLGNEAAAPRTWAIPAPGSGSHPRVAPDLDAVMSEHGTAVVIPLHGGPTIDAALPHRSLVLLVPRGA
ncbi:hypothetical protein [Nesterenkonia alkaliphila]|uniref:YcaO domain-containing protein n=1 Tax=Nesterenkonia alkaliphila TaxID=1463631 RepID=A0A7K1UF62_9MICC|nr:hypothetical protein [Nesterenkonia alkaliphila]MVT25113.1 hypothetical protein [Nesterenkonia alkaliphila]GFZ82838.1 hypothetical protein GCM10011359_09420 [Nesterenkonia alkaliphila]